MVISAEPQTPTTSQVSLAIKSMIETGFGDIRAVTNYEMDKDRNIRGNFRDRRSLNHAFRITPDGKLSYVELKSGRSDTFEIALHLNGIVPTWLSEEYLKGVIETHLDKGADQCSKGTPCGQACIERGDRCRIDLPANQMPKLVRVQNAIEKAQNLPIMQSPKANFVAGAAIAAAVVGLGSAAIISKRVADERGRADRITERRVERNKKYLEGEYQKSLEAESQKQKTKHGKDLENQKGKLQDANKAKTETLQKRNQEKVSRLEAQYKQRLANLEATFKSKTAAQDATYKQRAKSLEAEHKAKIAAQDAEYKKKVKELENQNKAGQKNLTAAQESAYKQRVKELEGEHKSRIAEQDKAYQVKVRELEAQNKAALKTKADAQESAYKQRVKALDDAHKARIAEQDKAHQARIRELEAQNKAALSTESSAQTQAYNQRVKALDDAHKARIAEQDKAHKARIRELETQNKAALKTQADAQTREHNQRLKALEDEQRKKSAAQDKAYNDRLKALEDDYQAKVAEHEEANQKRAQEIEEQGQMLIGAQTSAHNLSYEKRVKELESQHQARVSEQNAAYEKRAQELESQHQKRLEEIERERTTKSNQLESDHKQRLKEVSDREFELEQRESTLRERESHVEQRSRNLESDHDKRMVALQDDFNQRLVQIEREFLNRSTELNQRSEQLESSHRQRSQELEDSYHQRLQQLQEDFRTRFEQESAAEQARVNDEFIQRMATERESINAAAQEKIRKATQPKANRPGYLVSTSESGINLSASVDQGMPLGGTSGLTREAMQERVNRSLSKFVAEQQELGMKSLAQSFRTRTKEIQALSSGIPKSRSDAQKQVDAKWNALERALMQQNRRESGFEEAVERIRKDYEQGHSNLLDQLFQEGEKAGGVYNPRSLKRFDQAAARIHRQMLKEMKDAITELNTAKEMRLDRGKRCGNGWTSENNQCRTPGSGRVNAPLPTLTQKKLLTGAAIATIGAVGIGTAIALNRKPRQPPEPRHSTSTRPKNKGKDSTPAKKPAAKTPAKEPDQPKTTEPKPPIKEPGQPKPTEPKTPAKKPAQAKSPNPKTPAKKPDQIQPPPKEAEAVKQTTQKKEKQDPKNPPPIPERITDHRQLVWFVPDSLKGENRREVEKALDLISEAHKLNVKIPELAGKRPIIVLRDKDTLEGRRKNQAGAFSFSDYVPMGKKEREISGLEIAIAGRSKSLHPTRSVFVHEYGHALDMTVFGKLNGYASQNPKKASPEFRKVVETIDKSAEVQFIQKTLKEGKILLEDENGKPVAVKANKKYLKYLNHPSEKFARAYEQYVAMKTGDKKMLQNIKRQVEDGGYLSLAQWSRKEFVPIEKSFDELFSSMGKENA